MGKTILELLEDAKKANYIFPVKEKENYDREDILFDAIHTAINNEMQIKACLIVLNMFPPIKLFVKQLINKYIKKFTQK